MSRSNANFLFAETVSRDGLQIELLKHLDTRAICRLQRSSVFFKGISSNSYLWQLQIERDFAIPLATQTKVSIVAKQNGIDLNFQAIYKHLHMLKHSRHIKSGLRYFAFMPENQSALFAVCAGITRPIPAFNKHFINSTTIDAWIKIAIHAGCNLLQPFHYRKEIKNRSAVREYVEIAIEAGNLDVVSYACLKAKCGYEFRELDVNRAAESGNLELLNFILSKNKCLRPTELTLERAVMGGNITMIKYLFETFNLKPDHEAYFKAFYTSNQAIIDLMKMKCLQADLQVPSFNDSILYYAANSGNVEFFQFHLAKRGLLVKHPTPNTAFLINHCLSFALLAVKPDVFLYLIAYCTQHNILMDSKLLNMTARSGSMICFTTLLTFILWHELDKNSAYAPDQKTMNEAVLSGNCELVKFLYDKPYLPKTDQETLDAASSNPVTVDFPDETLDAAARSSNPVMVDFLKKLKLAREAEADVTQTPSPRR